MAGQLNHLLRTVMTRLIFMALTLLCIYGFGLFVQQQILAMGDTVIERQQELRANQQTATAARESASAKADQEQDAMAASRAQFEADRRRAFDASYEAPAGCDAPRSERQLKECANHKMRAKRTFFTQYGSGPYGTTASRTGGSLRYDNQAP